MCVVSIKSNKIWLTIDINTTHLRSPSYSSIEIYSLFCMKIYSLNFKQERWRRVKSKLIEIVNRNGEQWPFGSGVHTTPEATNNKKAQWNAKLCGPYRIGNCWFLNNCETVEIKMEIYFFWFRIVQSNLQLHPVPMIVSSMRRWFWINQTVRSDCLLLTITDYHWVENWIPSNRWTTSQIPMNYRISIRCLNHRKIAVQIWHQ